jgi:ABC-2 type transport system permease protein
MLAACYRAGIQADIEYRINFWMQTIAALLRMLTSIAGVQIAFQYTDAIHGWSFPHVLVLFGVYHLVDGLIETFIAPSMRTVMTQVRDGGFDFVLLKPVNAQFLATFRQVNFWQLGSVLIGVGLVLYTITLLSLRVGIVEAGAFAITLAAGLLVIYAFWLFLVTLTFWFVRIDNIEQIIWQAYVAGKYPVDIYPRWLRITLTYIIPVAIMITVPAQALTGRLEVKWMMTYIMVSLVAFIAATCFWRFGLKHYTGASS